MPNDRTIAISQNCDDCPIRHRAVCARCDTDELERLDEIKYYRKFEAGQTVVWSGDHMDFVGSVVSGIATLTQTMEDGRTQMVGLLLPSDFVGRPDRTAIDFDVIANDNLTLCCFDRLRFKKLIEETPHVAHRLMELALDELDAARDWMLLLGRKTAREKIATFIEMLARRSVDGDLSQTQDINLHMTRDQIANFLGLTLETVSRQFSALKKEGIIDFSDRRHFRVADHAALQNETGDDADGGVVY